MYADYVYYKNTYLGSILEESDFNRLSERASELIDSITFDRITDTILTTYETKIKKCCCALAEIFYKDENGGDIASENNDGYSISYVKGSNAKTIEQQKYDIAVHYLGMTGLLYRGL